MARRIEVLRNPQSTYALVGGESRPKYTKTVATKPGEVTWIDKAKGYYHTLITLIGAVLVFLNEATPLFGFLPVGWHNWINVGIVFLTAVANFLKKNEQWVNDL